MPYDDENSFDLVDLLICWGPPDHGLKKGCSRPMSPISVTTSRGQRADYSYLTHTGTKSTTLTAGVSLSHSESPSRHLLPTVDDLRRETHGGPMARPTLGCHHHQRPPQMQSLDLLSNETNIQSRKTQVG